jgi:predicted enzyme related to lactoylglutathione lyase
MTTRTDVTIRPTAVVVDVSDLDREIVFWTALLAMGVSNRSEDWADLEPLGGSGPVLALQLVPETKRNKNRLHFDLEVDDFTMATRRASELGGQPVSAVHSPSQPWQVWADPEGNEFCLITAD